jgi:hypothetical protein
MYKIATINSRYIGKTDRCLYTRTKEHSYHTESVIHQHLSTCEQFQHIKALLELYPDDDAQSNQTSKMAEHVFHNTKVIDKSITTGSFCCIKNHSLFKYINLNLIMELKVLKNSSYYLINSSITNHVELSHKLPSIKINE